MLSTANCRTYSNDEVWRREGCGRIDRAVGKEGGRERKEDIGREGGRKGGGKREGGKEGEKVSHREGEGEGRMQKVHNKSRLK